MFQTSDDRLEYDHVSDPGGRQADHQDRQQHQQGGDLTGSRSAASIMFSRAIVRYSR